MPDSPSQMKLSMLLCDFAQVAEGKLNIIGGGWSFVGPDPAPMAIALKVDIPWTDGDSPHHWTLELTDEDGGPVWFPTPNGNEALIVSGEFQAYRPDDLRPGTPLDFPLAMNFPPLPLESGKRYSWRFTIDGQSEPEWFVGFSTRPAPRAEPQ